MQEATGNRTIAKNTMLLYGRMLLTLVVSLYTSRVTLNVLGVVDYGIYNIVGGVVSALNFLNTTLSTATVRYITFELGRGDSSKLKSIFANSCTVHLLLAAAILLIGETVGLWFVNNKLVIPAGRMLAANVVFQCALGSFIMNVLSVPYNGLIIAHEKMDAFSYISILETVLKLVIVWMLLLFDMDKLILYAFLWLGVSVLIRIIYSVYCVSRFPESRCRPSIERSSFREMLSFSGYNLCEVFANMMADQGVNILLNIHFGPVVNAARGIAVQVSSAITGFTHNLTTAINPQITKSYAAGNRDRMMSLVGAGGKYSFYMLILIATPVFFKAEYILHLWLGNPPEYSVEFIRLLILSNLCFMPTSTFYTAISSTGNIKNYQIMLGLFRFMVFPCCWLVLKFFPDSPVSVYFILLAFEIVGTIVKLSLLKRNTDFFNVWNYIKNIIAPCALVFAFVYASNFWLEKLFENNLWSLFLFVCLTVVLNALVVFAFGSNKEERRTAVSFVIQKIRRL